MLIFSWIIPHQCESCAV